MSRAPLRRGAAAAGLVELSQVVARKPYPSIDRLTDMQRIMVKSTPAVLGLSIKDIVDESIVRKLEANGFIEGTYAAYDVAADARL